MTHTPGPWQTKDDHTPEGRITIIANIDGEYFTDSPSPCMTYDTIGTCVDEYGGLLPEEVREANACLIAAAPELLEAAQEIIAMWDDEYKQGGLVESIAKLRAAIIKAIQP